MILEIQDHETITGNTLGLHSRVAMSGWLSSPEICLQLLLSTFSQIFLTLFSTQTFHILSALLIHHKATKESVQQTILQTTTSTDIALTTVLTNFDSKRQDKSSILGIDKPLLDTTFDLALTNFTVILSLYIALA